MTKITKEDDPEPFINSFKRMEIAAGWPRGQWAVILTPYLNGAAQAAVDTLPLGEAKDYALVRRTIMSTLNITEETYRMRMREAIYSQEKGPQ